MMAKLWRNYGEIMAKLRRNYDEIMAKLWRNYGEIMAELTSGAKMVAQGSQDGSQIGIKSINKIAVKFEIDSACQKVANLEPTRWQGAGITHFRAGLGDPLWSSWVTLGHLGTPLESPWGSLSENHKKTHGFLMVF